MGEECYACCSLSSRCSRLSKDRIRSRIQLTPPSLPPSLLPSLPLSLPLPRFGWTALYEAAGTGHRHVLERLVQAGADPTIPATSWPRHVPSQMARQMGWNACVEVLMRAEKEWEALHRKEEQQEEETKAEGVLGGSQSTVAAAAAAAAAAADKGRSEKNEGDLSASSSYSFSSSSAATAVAGGKKKGGDRKGSSSSFSSSSTSNGTDVAAAAVAAAEEAASNAAIPPYPPSSTSSFTFASSSSSSSPITSAAATAAATASATAAVAAAAAAPAETDKALEEATAALALLPPFTPSNKTELPACLRWQVEEGVGEGGHEGRWGGWEEAEEDWLEVHPAVFSKRGPRVGRRRMEGGGAGMWVLGCLRRNKTLTNLATGRTSGRIKARAGSRRNPRWVVQKE